VAVKGRGPFTPRCVATAQKEILARIAEGSAWRNTFNDIPLDAVPSSRNKNEVIFKVRHCGNCRAGRPPSRQRRCGCCSRVVCTLGTAL
jgi:hypothetical protein